MWIRSISIKNIQSFENPEDVELSRGINVFTGHNNSGKSTLLKSASNLQNENQIILRRNKQDGGIMLTLEDISEKDALWYQVEGTGYATLKVFFSIKNNSKDSRIIRQNGTVGFGQIPAYIPHNFIHEFTSQRKPKDKDFVETVNPNNVNSLTGDFRYLFSKIDEIVGNTEHPNHIEFCDLTEKIFGFKITSFASGQGKNPGLTITNQSKIPITLMGEGVKQILGFLVDLVQAENKLFLIEEPENDLHPEALKKLLDFIIRKASNNQFMVTTHSNIVLKYLGAAQNAKIFNLEMELNKDKIPTSSITLIPNEPEARRNILEKLGYELYDFDLYLGWIIFEESSAESIIREYFIKWFTPDLMGKIRPVASQGVNDIEPRLIEFERLFTFIHLQDAYKKRAWVFADGDNAGKDVIKKLKNKYKSWDPNHFQNFSKENFEYYYPEEFQEEVIEVLKIQDSDKKRERKRELLLKVEEWIKDDDMRAQKWFEQSAPDIIEFLLNIKKQLLQ